MKTIIILFILLSHALQAEVGHLTQSIERKFSFQFLPAGTSIQSLIDKDELKTGRIQYKVPLEKPFAGIESLKASFKDILEGKALLNNCQLDVESLHFTFENGKSFLNYDFHYLNMNGIWPPGFDRYCQSALGKQLDMATGEKLSSVGTQFNSEKKSIEFNSEENKTLELGQSKIRQIKTQKE